MTWPDSRPDGRAGKAELGRLKPGVYEVRARMRGRGTRLWSQTVNAEVGIGQPAELELRIPG